MNSVQRHAPALVADRLTELARQEASGALRVGGDPGGIIYLNGGRLAFAESEVVPDLGSRLVNSRRLRVDQWHLAQRDSHPGGSAGDLLLRRGLLDETEWHALVRSAALDALLALASQMIRARAAAGTSFVPHQAPRNGPVLGMDIGPAWDHAWHEAVRLAGYDVAPDARLRLRGRTRLAFGREAAAVLGQMDGRATIRELAWRNGLALFAMMDWAVRLIQDGVCAITSPEYAAARQPNTAARQPNAAGQHNADVRQHNAAVRQHNAAVRQHNAAVRQDNAAVRQDNAAVRQQNAAGQQTATAQWTQPDLSLLGRVLTKLRQLD